MSPTGTVEQLLDVMHTRSRDDIKRLVKFTGAHPGTVGGWLLGTSKPPSGEMFIRVAFFFELSSWKVDEMERLDPLIADMVRYWMAEVTNPAELKHALSYTADTNSDLLAVFHGTRRPLSIAGLQRLLQLMKNDYHRRLEQLKADYGMVQDVPEPSTTPTPSPPPPASSGLLPEHQALVVSQLAALLREAKPLADRVNSDDYSDEQRATLRKLVGTYEYFELSTTLNQLTGPRQREARR